MHGEALKQKGSTVMYAKYAGTDLELGGRDFVLLKVRMPLTALTRRLERAKSRDNGMRHCIKWCCVCVLYVYHADHHESTRIPIWSWAAATSCPSRSVIV